jgi:copper resistance protein C
MKPIAGACSRALITVGASGVAMTVAGMRKFTVGVLCGAVLTVLALAGAGVASAHATRIATDPAENAVLTQSPQRVSATFNEALQTVFAAMTVVGPDGNLWSTGDAQVQGAVIGVGVRPLGPAGTYTVNYRATSADGHVVSGSWSFQLTVASTGTPGPSATATANPTDNGMPIWPFVLIAAVIVGGGAIWAVRRRP